MKIKLLFCFILLTLNFSLTYGQSWLWGRLGYGPVKPTMGASATAGQLGSLYVIGYYADLLIFKPDTLIGNSGSPGQVFLAKFNPAGQVLWLVQPTTTELSGAAGAATDYRNYVYVTGNFGGVIDFGTHILGTANSGNNVFLAKYDSGGNAVWARAPIITPANQNAASGTSVTIDHNTLDVLITGYFADTVTFGTTVLKSFRNPSQSVFIAKYDSGGNVLWARQAKIASVKCVAFPASIITDVFHNVYATGSFNDTISFGSHTLIAKSGESVYLVKYSPSGNLIWAIQSNTNSIGDEISNSVTIDNAQKPYITGKFVDTIKFGSRQLTGDGAYLFKFDSNGNAIWGDMSSSGGHWEGWSVASDGGAHIYLTAEAENTDSVRFGTVLLSGSPMEFNEACIMKFDTDGTPLCGSYINNLGFQNNLGFPVSLAINSSGSQIYTVGTFTDDSLIFGPDTLLKQGFFNIAVARWKNCSTSSGLDEQKTVNPTIAVYPNPFSNATTIIVESEKYNAECYLELDDITGRKLRSIEFTGNSYTLSAESLAKGMYFIRVSDKDKNVIGTSKIVVQ